MLRWITGGAGAASSSSSSAPSSSSPARGGSSSSSSSADAGSSSPDSLADLAALLRADLRASIRAIAVQPPLSATWCEVAARVAKVAAIVEAERRLAADEAAAAASPGAAPRAAGAAARGPALWDSEELALRNLMEDGKLNLLLRLTHDYCASACERLASPPQPASSLALGEAASAAAASAATAASAAAAAASGGRLARAGDAPDAEEASRRFEHAAGLLLRVAWEHSEAVQTTDLPLAAAALTLCMEAARRAGAAPRARRGAPHPRPQLVALALRLWAGLGGAAALAAVGDDRLARELLRAAPPLAAFGGVPALALAALLDCDGAGLERGPGAEASDGLPPFSALSLEAFAAGPAAGAAGAAMPPPPPALLPSGEAAVAATGAPTPGGDLVALAGLAGAAALLGSEDALGARPRLVAGADAALAAAAALSGGGGGEGGGRGGGSAGSASEGKAAEDGEGKAADGAAAAPPPAQGFAGACAVLRGFLVTRLSAAAGGAPEARRALRPLLDLLDLAVRRAAATAAAAAAQQ